MRSVVFREEYPDGGARETLACGHVLYITDKRAEGERRCLACLRKPARKKREQQR